MRRLTLRATTSALASLMLPISGCVIWPHYCVECFGVKSRVVDADTGIPIKGATVHDSGNPKRACSTDESGTFVLKPTYHWHGGYWFVALTLHIFPLTHDIILPSFAIAMGAPGYDEGVFVLVKHESTRPGRVENRSLKADFDGTYFSVLQFALRRPAPTTTQPTATSAPAS